MNCRVAIIVPVFKTYSFIQRLFNSSITDKLSGQFDWSLIFIDDSPEMNFDWPLLIEELAKINSCFKSISVLKNVKNRGVTYSRNRAYCKADADFVVFFDSDDVFAHGGLIMIEDELLKLGKSTGIVLMATDAGSKNRSVISSSSYHALLSDYGHGERLVVVRKNIKALPFIGQFRGHELAGLLRFQEKTKFGVKTSSSIVRLYLNDNSHSISRGKELRVRLPLIIKGHIYTACFLNKHGSFLWAIRFFGAAFFGKCKLLYLSAIK